MVISREKINETVLSYERRLKAIVSAYCKHFPVMRPYRDDLFQEATIALIDLIERRGTLDWLHAVYVRAIKNRLDSFRFKSTICKVTEADYKAASEEILENRVNYASYLRHETRGKEDTRAIHGMMLDEALATLPEIQRQIMTLDLTGYKKDEIIKILGLKDRHHLYHQKKQAKRQLAVYYGIDYDDMEEKGA